MNNNHISLFVEMSDEDKLLEQALIKERREVGNKINIAITQHEPYRELMSKESEIYQRIKELKGTANTGQRQPINSTELAQALIVKLDKFKELENEYLNSLILDIRNKQQNNKDVISEVIARCQRAGLDKLFPDIGYSIKFWTGATTFVFDKKGEDLGKAWAYYNGMMPLIAKGYNLLTHLIFEIIRLESKVDEIEHQKKFTSQIAHLESCAQIVASATNDNDVFIEIFLMGQYASNLNNSKLQINKDIKKRAETIRKALSSVWSSKLAHNLYIDYWIHGHNPTASEACKKYSLIVEGKSLKTVTNQMTGQRKIYASYDKRVKKVTTRGRNKKV